MCGRYVIARTPGQLALPFDAQVDDSIAGGVEPNWNVAPTHTVPILLERLSPDGQLLPEIHAARWGLVPSWAKELSIGSKMFNARSETVTEKPSFRAAVKARRCAIPADGYYEWKAPEPWRGKKQPYFVYPEDGSPIWFAGIYEWWHVPDDAADLPHVTRALYVGGGGDVAVRMMGGGEAVFRNLQAGSLIPIRATRILAAGTTAGDLVGLW